MQQQFYSDLGTPESREKAICEWYADALGRSKLRLLRAPIDKMHKRKAITEQQWQAGNKLRCDWVYSGISGSSRDSLCLSEIKGLQPLDSESQYDAYRAYLGAMLLLTKPMQRLVRGVCCEERSVADAARESEVKQQYADVTFKNCLDILAIHYGFIDRRGID